MNDKEVFENYESEVRSYCRIFNEELDYAKNSKIRDVNGKEYIENQDITYDEFFEMLADGAEVSTSFPLII